MRKNYFAKKFVAYSMAFAVAFSTLTVSPVFVKEAKAGTLSLDATTSNFNEATDSQSYAGYLLLGDVTTKLADANVNKSDLGFTSNDKIAGIIGSTGVKIFNATSATAGSLASTAVGFEPSKDVVFNGKINGTEDPNGNKDVTISKTGVTGAKWYHLLPKTKEVGYTVTGTTDTVKVPYYELESAEGNLKANTSPDTLEFPEVNADQLGIYVAIKANSGTPEVKAVIEIKEISDMNAKASQKTIYSALGKSATLGVDITGTSTRPVTYTWTRNGKELGTDATLNVTANTTNDFGTYSCKVSDGLKSETVTVNFLETKDTTVDDNVKNRATSITTYKNVLQVKNGQYRSTETGTVKTEAQYNALPASAYETAWVATSDLESDGIDLKGDATVVKASAKNPSTVYKQVYATDADTQTTYTTAITTNKQLMYNGTDYKLSGDGYFDDYKDFYVLSSTVDASTLFELPSTEFTVTTSIPENDNLVYVWTGARSMMSDAEKVNYSANNRTISLNQTKVGSFTAPKTITVKAYEKTAYEVAFKDELKAVNEAAAYEKVSKVDALMNREASLPTADVPALFTETIYLQPDTSKDVSEVKVLSIGDSLNVSAPTNTITNTTPTYPWTHVGVTSQNVGTLNAQTLKINTLGITDFGTYTCNKNDGTKYTVNVVYVSDLASTAQEMVTAKVGAKDIKFTVNATATLPVKYTWTRKNSATAGTQGTGTAKNEYTLPTIDDINDEDIFASYDIDGKLNTSTGKYYECKVSDGITTKTYNFNVKQVVGFTVDGKTVDSTDKITTRKDSDVVLAPVVKLDESKEVTYSWTKTGSSTVLSTDPTFTFKYADDTVTDKYEVTITDGVQKIVKKYEISKLTAINTDLDNYKATNVDSVVYDGKEQTGDVVVKFTHPTTKATFTLVNGKDYTISYEENINVGIARYEVKFIGEFASLVSGTNSNKKTLTGTFFIDRADNELKVADKVVAVGGSVQPKTTNKAGAAVTYTYYTDEACTTAIEGVPTKVGVYYVKATSVATANYNQATSNVAKVVIAPGKPKIGNTSRTASSITLNWAKTSGATAYRVYIKKNGKFTKVANTTELKYTVTGLASATTYEFAVKAFVKGVASPVYSVRKTTTAPAKVATPAVKAGSRKATVSFKKVTRATGYQVYMAKGNGKYVKVATTAKLSVTKTGLTKGATYKFKVRAYKKVGSNVYYGAFSSAKAVKVK